MNLFTVPLLFGIFGWVLVWGLIKLFFYPLQPFILGPIRLESMAHRWINQINLIELLPKLSKNDSFEALKPVINEKLDDFFRHKLSAKLPMISMFIGDKTIHELKGVFMEELAIIFPLLINTFSANLNKDLHQLWQDKLSKLIVQKVIKATQPIRWIAFGLGLIWGLLITLILPFI